jgi:hypothetical protein
MPASPVKQAMVPPVARIKTFFILRASLPPAKPPATLSPVFARKYGRIRAIQRFYSYDSILYFLKRKISIKFPAGVRRAPIFFAAV